MKKIYSFIIAFLLVGSLTIDAQVYNVSATASGAQEVPPNASPGTASLAGTYDTSTGMMTLNINFSGLATPTVQAHIHSAPAGSNGPVIIGLPIPVGVTAGNIAGSFAVPAVNEADLLAGNFYLNIHTQMQPGGEIRGQISAVQEIVPTLGQWAVIGLTLILMIFGIVAVRQRQVATVKA